MLHRLDRRALLVESFALHKLLDPFNHHDGVVHHQADGQHQAEERQRVDAVAKSRQHHKGGAERDRDGDRWNQRGAPVLQKNIADDDHKQEGQPKRGHNFTEAGADKFGGVVGEYGFKTFGIILLEPRQFTLQRIHGVEGVGTWCTAQAQRHTGSAVVFGGKKIVVGSFFDACNVLEVDHRTVGAGAHHDIAEGFGIIQPSLRDQGEGDLSGAVVRCGADGADGGLHILVADGRRNFVDADAEGGDAVGIEPDAHAVFGAINLCTADAWDPFNGRLDDFIGIVAHQLFIKAVVGRADNQEAEHVG